MITPRWAVATVFAVHGSVSGSLAARMPWIAEHVGVSGNVGRLGYALVMPAVGALLTMPFAGRLVHRIGGRLATQVLISGWAAALTLLAVAPSLPTLAAAMFVAGAFAGTADMAMNAEAIAVERALGRSIMSGLHGLWSVGTVLAGGAGWLLAHLDVDARAHFAGASALLIVVGLWAGTAVYLVGQLGTGDATGAVGYAGFAGAMTAGRLTGDAVVRAWGPVTTVRVAGALGVLGGVLIVLGGALGSGPGGAPAALTATAIGGFVLVGVGIAVVVPLAFAAAGHSAGTAAGRAHAIAAVATVAYGAGLAAPGIVGGIAEATSLTVSFVVVTALVAAMTLAARAVRPADVPASPGKDLAATGA